MLWSGNVDVASVASKSVIFYVDIFLFKRMLLAIVRYFLRYVQSRIACLFLVHRSYNGC